MWFFYSYFSISLPKALSNNPGGHLEQLFEIKSDGKQFEKIHINKNIINVN